LGSSVGLGSSVWSLVRLASACERVFWVLVPGFGVMRGNDSDEMLLNIPS